MRFIVLTLVGVLFLPFAVGAVASPECQAYIDSVRATHPKDQQSQAPNTAIQNVPADTSPDKTPELRHKETNDEITIKDGNIRVVSSCGDAGQIGSISICNENQQNCGTKIPKKDGDTVSKIAAALSSGTGRQVEEKFKSLAEAFKAQAIPESAKLPSLSKGQIQRALVGAGFPSQYLDELDKRSTPAQKQKLLDAIATGDEAAIREAAEPIKRTLRSESFGIYNLDTRKFANSIVTMQEAAQPKAQVIPEYFCALENTCRAAVTGFTVETGSVTPGPSLVAQLSAQPIPVGAGGQVDPVSFYAHAVKAARAAGLDGYADPRLQSLGLLRSGSAEEWGRLYTMIAKQESSFNVNAAAPSECSYGILQFCPGEYGLGSMQDVRNPESALQAVIQVTRQGKLFQYFGSLQRPHETAQHAGWFNQAVAPQVSGEVPYAPVTNTGRGGYWSDTAANVGTYMSGLWSSPGVSGVSSYSPSAAGGSPNLLTSIFGLVSRLFSGSGNQGSDAQSPTAPGAASPAPTAPAATPAISKPVAAPIVHPIISFAAPDTVDKGDSFVIIWAATGVSSGRPCELVELSADNTLRGRGNSGTYFVHVPASFGESEMHFRLACTPADVRALQSEAVKELSITIR